MKPRFKWVMRLVGVVLSLSFETGSFLEVDFFLGLIKNLLFFPRNEAFFFIYPFSVSGNFRAFCAYLVSYNLRFLGLLWPLLKLL